ncbi:MAG: DNA polymerase III subunit beta [Gammaproteobacteria bacterium]|jgi:DNA polymerase-3 subunit beta|nr:DNA polymerase III subunit beta [Gammaproteobacteria bacterium]HJL96372.1 DNA polymerase III subunit beta [SAR86 cluster bacterium]HJM59366.1 DNA polymerase III subunit beta [SAR86 cluster bacterium]|tara:strand:- start:4708 stop:5808 length:1101 start_codon:yes stop_codon:yes gene_type:complete
MKFTTEKSQIVDSLQNAAAVAERRQTIPILANVRIKALGESLEVTATDLEIQIKTFSSLSKVEEEGETTVSARKMSELCRSLPDGEKVEFSLGNGKLTVSSKNFHADFATISADDFPELEITEEQSSMEVPSNTLKRILNKTSFSMASQDVRYYLNGLLLEINGKELKGVATDGHRLALSKSTIKQNKIEFKSILPRKAALELGKLLLPEEGPVTLSFGPSYVDVKTDTLNFSSKLIDGKYPDYEKVFPSGEPSPMIIGKETLQSALSRASVLSNEKYRGVRFQLSKGALKLTANNPEQESAEEILEVKYDDSDLEVGFNIGYLIDVLGSLESEEVKFEFFGEDSSCVIKEPSSEKEVYVIMPMRL